MKLVLKKTASLIITLFIVSLLAFLAFQIIPGDPTTKILGTNASAQKAEALREQLGLNRPVTERYLDWLVSFLQGDFGTSYSYLRPVSSLLADKLPVTALLTLLSFALTALLSIPLGIASGSMRSQAADHLAVITDQIIMAIPPFFFRDYLLLCIRRSPEMVPARQLYPALGKRCRLYGIPPASRPVPGAAAHRHDGADAARIDP